jgi:hypothetical protein
VGVAVDLDVEEVTERPELRLEVVVRSARIGSEEELDAVLLVELGPWYVGRARAVGVQAGRRELPESVEARGRVEEAHARDDAGRVAGVVGVPRRRCRARPRGVLGLAVDRDRVGV